jgi:hypothetical protein
LFSKFKVSLGGRLIGNFLQLLIGVSLPFVLLGGGYLILLLLCSFSLGFNCASFGGLTTQRRKRVFDVKELDSCDLVGSVCNIAFTSNDFRVLS